MNNDFIVPRTSKFSVFFVFVFLIDIVTLLSMLKLTLGAGDVTKVLLLEEL